MTSRPVFGDFAGAAGRQLATPPCQLLGARVNASGGTTVGDVSDGVRAAVNVMARYAADVSRTLWALPPEHRAGNATWLHAAERTGVALSNAAGLLEPPASRGDRQPEPDWAQWHAASGMRAAAASMTLGRDLLQTHLDPEPGTCQAGRSEWAPVITSVPVSCAVLSQLGRWARRIATHGCQAAITGPGRTGDRRNLNAACQWLWMLTWAVGSAQEEHPVTADVRHLLNAIPLNTSPERQLPAEGSPAAVLCEGIIDTADRLRAAARSAAANARWSSRLTRESFRHTAGTCAITAANCATVLATLAGGPAGTPAIRAAFGDAHRLAESARAAWLTATTAWDAVRTDSSGSAFATATAGADLALWTGRLAYATPGWTPNLGPRHPARPATELAATPHDLRRVVTAVHYVCHTLEQVAAAEHSLARTAAQEHRLIVPTRNLPEEFDVPYRLAPAPGVLAAPLLDAYRDAGAACHQALTAVAGIAARVQAPSHVLTTGRAAAAAKSGDSRSSGWPRAAAPADRERLPVPPGPVERILLDLNVVDQAALREAAILDATASQLILRAASEPRRDQPAVAADLSHSAGTAEVINDLLATRGDQIGAALDPRSGIGRNRPAAGASSRGKSSVSSCPPASPHPAERASQSARHSVRGVLTSSPTMPNSSPPKLSPTPPNTATGNPSCSPSPARPASPAARRSAAKSPIPHPACPGDATPPQAANAAAAWPSSPPWPPKAASARPAAARPPGSPSPPGSNQHTAPSSTPSQNSKPEASQPAQKGTSRHDRSSPRRPPPGKRGPHRRSQRHPETRR